MTHPGRVPATTRIRVALALAGLLAVALAVSPPRAEAAGAIVAHGSARQVWLTGLPAGATFTLLDKAGHKVARKRADAQGGLLFRNVEPGAGYRVRAADGRASAKVTVHSEAATPWSTATYDQKIPSNGYGYLTTRDGTKLAYTVHPPTSPASLGIGLPAGVELPNLNLNYTPPYPTLIEYSGYGTAIPKGPENGIATLANLMGFAVVDVSIRGTGCSGGAFDFFEPLQSLDGYDVIETIARQPWVKGHKVGMMGISYGAISQLFTAQTNPPHLAAIAPLSTIDSVATTLFPGGILNTGFALAWAKERVHDALPAGPKAGQPWAYDRIRKGDRTCQDNQALHGQAIDLLAKIKANSHYIPASADPLDPITFVHKIKVPVFLACQWQDEQTGGHCPAMVRHFTGTKKKWFTFTNGAHVDSVDPETFNRWYDFLSLYVARQAPAINAVVLKATAPLIFQTALGIPSSDLMTLPHDPIQAKGGYAAALAAFEKLPRVRVLFDNGAGKTPLLSAATQPGNPYPGYEHSFSTFPVPGTVARSWYLGSKGRLLDRPTKRRGVERYVANPRAVPANNFLGGTGTGGLWGNASQWSWSWRQRPPGTAVSYLTSPLRSDTTVLGAGAVYAWVRSSKPNVDFQATITEVSPDGKETFVQSGWLRGNMRALAKGRNNVLKQQSTLLEPVISMRKADVRPLPRKRFVRIPIPLYFQGHAYRTGSRIRVTISAVNGDQPIWAFAGAQPRRPAAVAIAHSGRMRSRVVLPVVPGLRVPTARPACGILRNQPCRDYRPS
ncbi:CocE/NonD family hydrolase [Nocardioides marmoriginsengisoli]|uniref:CocE/NonD family hydrolase n=1 Tax=Nocardioides marmoriginsengisoli TaxID=661483 RepID=A0A3N0CAP2_9ACTN|nr:CocE/NonD family hydrolase [Nocardioides marmoriginsengisoli]RNL60534.1 CocE/NonD family hydrolase [Nocardioides marmoriginsengisoli]